MKSFTNLIKRKKSSERDPKFLPLESNPYAGCEKQKLGNGACGEVYMYFDFEVKIAVKEIPKKQRDAVEDYRNELAAFKAVGDHKHVVQYKCTWIDMSHYYIAMELCEGGSLDGIRERLPDYTEETVKMIIKQVSEALQSLNKNKVCHRDIKPDNILVRTWNPINIALTDFNFATQPKAQLKTTLSTTLGTDGYKAPEVEWDEFRKIWMSQDGKLKTTYNHKCDIFSLGVVMFKLLSGFLSSPYEIPLQSIIDMYQTGASDEEMGELLEEERIRVIKDRELIFAPTPHWANNVSEDARSLCQDMLEPDYRFRCSYEQILNSSWLSSTDKATIPLYDKELYEANEQKMEEMISRLE